jgi:[acyl-carrier-protein] S-malonyltransferase
MSSLAIVFPGQGSQTCGMLLDFAKQFPQILERYQEASDSLGYDLWHIVQHDEAKLNQTEFTQPAILTASVALWQLLQPYDLHPTLLAGHSLGEYSALVCSKSLSFQDAVRLVSLRGQLMQQAVPEGIGAMAAIIGLETDQVATLCQEASQGEVCSPANFNAIGQTVISGNVNAVNRAVELAKTAGAKIAKTIPVSVPSHCELMKPAAEKLALALEKIDFNKPNVPLIHNVDIHAHQNADDIRKALILQLFSPVRWVETIQYFSKNHITTIIECGPGKVLSGLNKRIDSNINTLTIDNIASFEKLMEGIPCN